MKLDKINPWNWFKHEQTGATGDATAPVKRSALAAGDGEFSGTGPLAGLHREMDRVFDTAFENFGLPSLKDSNFFSGRLSQYQPKIDVSGDKNRYEISLDVPGLSEKDLDIDVSGDVLTIRGHKEDKHEEKDKHYYRMERRYGSFQRTLALPSDAVGSEIEAKLENGVLALSVPRRETIDDNRRRIEIKS